MKKFWDYLMIWAEVLDQYRRHNGISHKWY